MPGDAAFPNDDPIDETEALASLDRTLDTLFDDRSGRAAQDAPPGRPSPLAGTAVALRALDDARPPAPTFAAALEDRLMSVTALDQRSLRPAGPPSVLARHAARTTLVRRRPRAASTWRRGLIEVVSFAAMIALLLTQTIGFGGNLAFWRQGPANTPTPGQPISAQGDDGTPTDASPQLGGSDVVAVERGNAGRTGEYATTGPVDLPSLLWRYSDPNGEPIDALEPIIAGDEVHLSILRGNGYAVSPFTLPGGEGGFSYWLRTTGDNVNVAFGNGMIYAASTLSADRENGGQLETPALVAYDAVTKQERWRVEVEFAGGSSPVLAGDTLVILGNDALIALDALTGEERWRAPVAAYGPYELPVLRNPAVDGDTVVVNEVVADEGTGVSGTLRAFDLATGTERWSIPSDGGHFGPASAHDGVAYAYEVTVSDCCAGGRLRATDAATGAALWSAPDAEGDPGPIGAAWGAPVVDSANVVTFDRDAAGTTTLLTARDRSTGGVTWQRDLGDVYGSQISLADGVLYFTLSDGGVYAADAASGEELWRIDTGDAGLGTPVPADGYLVIASRTAVYAFAAATDPDAAASDVSGLPECVSPRVVSDTPPTGEPVLSLVGLEDNPLGFGVPTGGRMLLADVPAGEAAGDAAVAGIFATIRGMTGCQRPGSELDLAGFYSDDYFRRFDQIEGRPGSTRTVYAGLFPVDTIAVGDLGAPFTLEDGRVAVLAFDPLGDRGTLLVFVERDGAWLIDEVVEVGRDAEVWRQG